MKLMTLLITAILPLSMAVAENTDTTSEPVTAYDVMSAQNRQTYTYVRCWYRPAGNHDDPATDWEWALDEEGNDYRIYGYWWSSVRFKNMFYTDTSQHEIKQRCEETLGVSHDSADITYFAADNRFSYNHSIWTNDKKNAEPVINKMVTIGDSLSDTGNIFNASQWKFPNPNSWFLGHFSNGFVWTEYLAKMYDLPVYNWAIGGAAGRNQYIALKGVNDQVRSYLNYMTMAKHYQPENTLFTLGFGLNDFMNYNHEVYEVKADFSRAMIRLVDSGAKNIILLTLPDATKAPQFKYSTAEEIEKVSAKITAFNAFIQQQALYYRMQGINIILFDAHSLFENLTANPQQYGFENATDACLNINRNSALDYLYRHSLTNDCAYHSSDKYVFWGVTHPTTAIHKLIADEISKNSLASFQFK
ncbi:thermolabile hemolysin [Vibrio qinghaiensis]|uniref:Thermolabile hemolysin n=1 Tax=Vibrio qinghaiensis TaxID=2025808 RepID=A0A223N3T6_9VIBR|nr:SGNH/GDSL hydrolase family protein [Vibrio qinghaiensis]ASU24330.1 thermolabile hemolysin [Vibrio qinghaiensis]